MLRFSRHLALRLVLLIALLLGAPPLAATPSLAQGTPVASSASDAETVEITGAVTAPASLTVADLQQRDAETVEVTYTSGGDPEERTFTGTSLVALIAEIGLDVDPDASNPLLAMYLVVTAKDGYQVVLSGGELDPNFGNTPILLAWEEDGQLLTGEDGPVRLVVPGDGRGGRYVHGVISIEVRSLDADADAAAPASAPAGTPAG